jgi:hypothetical protein
MNFALKTEEKNNYIVTIQKMDDGYNVRSVVADDNGRLVCSAFKGVFDNEDEAKFRAKVLLKNKVKSRKWTPINVDELPDACAKYLAVPEDLFISQAELLELLKSAHKEVIVVFSDNVGLTENFDLDVEYVGFSTEDENIYKVYDKYGDLMNCFKTRLSIIGPTERALEAQSDRVRMIKSRMGV